MTYRRHAPGTRIMGQLSRWWMRFRKLKAGMMQASQDLGQFRDVPESVGGRLAEQSYISSVEHIKDDYKRRAERMLQNHILWPWLEDLPGLRRVSAAWLVGMIRDPHRFPGQKCEEGHYLRPEFEEGAPCPIEEESEDEGEFERCGAPLLAPRRGTGVRSLWHYCGLFPGAEKKSGQRASFVPEIKGICLAPKTGLASQIVMQGPEPYRKIYDEKKEELAQERGVKEDSSYQEGGGPLPKWQLNDIAKTVAVKAFVGDLLMEWKERQPLGSY